MPELERARSILCLPLATLGHGGKRVVGEDTWRKLCQAPGGEGSHPRAGWVVASSPSRDMGEVHNLGRQSA
jgi:hypothetical protein